MAENRNSKIRECSGAVHIIGSVRKEALGFLRVCFEMSPQHIVCMEAMFDVVCWFGCS